MNELTPAWIGLGSNLDNPQAQVQQAFLELSQLPNTKLEAQSSLWGSKPVGPQDQPDFINAAALLLTSLQPLELLDELQRIEQLHLRKRVRHWGPRSLDLDLLVYGQEQIHCPRLTVPHPEIANRAFVLLPLAEINPQLLIPSLNTVEKLLNQLSNDQLQGVLRLEAI